MATPGDPSAASELRTACEAARAAGQVLREGFAQAHQENLKGAYNLVTEMDIRSELLLSAMLRENPFRDYGFIGEEGTQARELSKPAVWIVDPLDGTTNYARGYPLFAVSIALKKGDAIVVAAVYNPLRDELFSAHLGCGATLNGQPIHVGATTELSMSLLSTGFPYDASTSPRSNTEELEHFIRRVISVRCDGSAALDLCHVAMGRLDGYWETGLDVWDLAAGALIVKEAGGVITLKSGGPFTPFDGSVVAANADLHAQMLEVLSKCEGHS